MSFKGQLFDILTSSRNFHVNICPPSVIISDEKIHSVYTCPQSFPITHRREHAYNCLIPDIVWKAEFWEHLKFGPSISIHRTYKPAGYYDLLPQNNGETLTLIPLNKLASIKLHIYLNPKGFQASNRYHKSSITQTKRLYRRKGLFIIKSTPNLEYHIKSKLNDKYSTVGISWFYLQRISS